MSEAGTTYNEQADAAIREKVLALLNDDTLTDASKMEVAVKDGNVVLKGKADTEEEKNHAGQIAASVEGVKTVENHLHVEIGIAHALSSFVARIISGDEKPDAGKEGHDEQAKNS